MRKRNEILYDGKRTEILVLEVLLDIRDQLAKNKPKSKKVKDV
jgi:hypothetical protein